MSAGAVAIGHGFHTPGFCILSVGASCNHIWSAEGEAINSALFSPLSAGITSTLATCAAGLGSAEDRH